MKLTFYQIDNFTDKLFGGNPAAVCPLESWLPDEVMQNIAAENNLSETAFFVPKDNYFELRWFTPNFEIDLCGHATLASAYVLFNHLGCTSERIHFRSHISGDLYVEKQTDLLYLDFPARPPEPCEVPEALLKGLSLKPQKVLKSRDYFALYESEADILKIEANYHELAKLDCIGIIVTAPGSDCDFVSRFFVPADPSIPEDPVTGSAHCTLIPYWSECLNKQKLFARQLSKRRGELFCENLGERLKIGGKGVLYCIGEINL